MKKKVLSVLLSMAMLTAALAGCGSTSNAPASDAPAAEAPAGDDAAAEAPAADGEASLTVWCWDPAFNLNAMYEAEKVYQKENPDFKLNVVETPWADIQTKLTTAATSNAMDTLPDIFLMQDNAFQKNVISFPEAFADLTGTGIDFSQFAAGKTAYSVVDGKNYGVPFDNGAAIACYRTDVLEEAGYKLEDMTDIDWDKYLEIGKVVLEKTGKPLLSCLSGESDVIMMMLQSAGSSLFDKDGNPAMVNNDVLKTVMGTYQKLKDAGVLIEVPGWDEYIGTMTKGTVAGTINGCWIMASIKTADDQSGKWGVTNLPKLVGVANATNYSNNGGSSWAVTSACKDVALAADFLGKTFGGSKEFYENILPSGALSTWLPAGDSDAYGKADDFFGGAAVSATITDFASKVPSNNTGVYYYEARDAIAVAMTQVLNGTEVDKAIKAAEDDVKFKMGQ